jgi:peptide-methionine (R)-S-oxide reductase
MEKITKTNEEWRKQLNPEQYRVLREAGTERPFTGEYVDTEDAGIYVCVGCGNELFTSDTKYHSGCGWPSFWNVMDEGNVNLHEDRSLGMVRVEVTCAKCDGHLGHVFPDGPRDKTGMRFCINSASLDFEAE